jgi:hypothetical protein
MEAARLVETRQHSAAPLAPATDLEEGRSPPIAAAPPSWRPGIAATRDSVVGQSPPASAQPLYFTQTSLQPPRPLASYHGSALPVLPARPSPRCPPPAVNAGDEVDYALYLAEARGVSTFCLASLLSEESWESVDLRVFADPYQGLVREWLAPQESARRPVYT